METGNKNVSLLNHANENGLLPIIMAELISADVLTSEEDCDRSIEILTGFLEAIDNTDIEDKIKWKGIIEDGLEIARRDKERFLKEKAPN